MIVDQRYERQGNESEEPFGGPSAPPSVPAAKNQDLYSYATFKLLKTQNLIHLLSSTQPYNRTEKECKMLAELLKSEPYFASIAKNQKALLEISNWIDYKRYSQDQSIYHLGDPSDCFYILIKGQVTLTAPEKVLIEETPEPLSEPNFTPNLRNTKAPSQLLTTPILARHKTNEEIKTESVGKKKLSKKPSMIHDVFITPITPITPPASRMEIELRIVRIVYKGESFGDLGDLSRRGTNATAKEVSHLMVIRKQNWDYLSKVQVKSDSKSKYEFLASLPFFKLLYRYSLEAITYFIEEKKLGYNHVLFRQSEAINAVYIIYRGEFKLYRKIQSKKAQPISRESRSDLQQTRTPFKNVAIKTIGPGQILGHCQVYLKQSNFFETCICRSQEGIVIRIDKNKFLKKVQSPDNQLAQIEKFVTEKAASKEREIDNFIDKLENDETHIRFLHTPSDRSRRVKTESSIERQQSQRKDALRKLSSSSQNFFSEFNQTVRQSSKPRRISINRSLKRTEQRAESVPSSIKDIVEMVKHESNYHQLRKPNRDVTLFEFNITKVPLHVKKKFDFLFKKLKR